MMLPSTRTIFDMGRRARRPSLQIVYGDNVFAVGNPADLVNIEVGDEWVVESDPYCPPGRIYISAIDRHSGVITAPHRIPKSVHESGGLTGWLP